MTGKANQGQPTIRYAWDKRDNNLFVCMGEAEVSRLKVGEPWVVMIPNDINGLGQKSWSLLSEDGCTRKFHDAKEAIENAEIYLNAFYQCSNVNRPSPWLDHGCGDEDGAFEVDGSRVVAHCEAAEVLEPI